jgi:hypothetical protein
MSATGEKIFPGALRFLCFIYEKKFSIILIFFDHLRKGTEKSKYTGNFSLPPVKRLFFRPVGTLLNDVTQMWKIFDPPTSLH